jgi:drug/metabolite transporter (DMT)-like permease
MSVDAKTIPARVVALQVVMCAVFGIGQIAAKAGLAGISPIYQAGLRSCGAVLLIALWIWLRKIPLNWRDGSGRYGMAIGLMFALQFVCLYLGLALTGAARATVLLYTAPFFVALGTHWFVPNDRLNRQKTVGLALAFAGVLVAFADRAALSDRATLLGDLLCVAAAICWAATTVWVKATPLRALAPEKTLLYQLVISALVLLPVSALVGEPGVFAPTLLVWSALAYQTIMVASVGYLTWFFLVSRYRASALSSFTFLTPVFGVLFAWLLLGEPISATIVVAVLLIAAGIVFVNRA